MTDPVKETIRGAAIVLLGSFNPPIFQPGWFAYHRLIDDPKDAETAKDVHVDAFSSYFETRLFGCEVTRDRFRLFSTALPERMEELGDVAANVFRVLIHTPVGGVSMISFRHVAPGQR